MVSPPARMAGAIPISAKHHALYAIGSGDGLGAIQTDIIRL